ncbi:uracil-DNA glycosylase [Amycolatopsis thailandensis]|uniref:Type-4 uracil-DNA glycosylase n=1 Tax=Amycolatopsis thailandensis TaxID=589330 RepID=A0A229RUD4_9PSEU|nr:UdgX family uracil-DNA binding protein [Amycolatopsis thailandensis]OXM50135.1 uracil-DNA glycosylase [Amycolatopsis thailandensis]
MATKAPGADPPTTVDLGKLRSAASGCRGCDLHRDATQTVFGEGPREAEVMVVGEQPGDQEDQAGAPFVGPAGRLLDRALDEAGFDRGKIYVTNAVKHFKFRRDERGKRRIHQTPSKTEIVACRPWLHAELAAVQPDLLIFLGATAAKSLLGDDFRVTRSRGERIDLAEFGTVAVATVHPSAVLRAPDRDEAYRAFVADLVTARGR